MNSGPAVRETFSRDDRLRKRRDFEECYASGVRVSGRHLQVFFCPAPGAARLGLSVPKRLGSSPARNRVRRRLREVFRRNRALLRGRGGRFVVNARASAAQASFAELSADFLAALSRALGKSGLPQ